MDLFGAVVTGLISAGIGLFVGIIPLWFARKRLIRFAFEAIGGYLRGFMEAILQDVVENPEKYKPVLLSLMNSMSADIEKEMKKQAGKVMGGVLPSLGAGGVGQLAGNFVPRKYRWVLGIAQAFGLKLPGLPAPGSESETQPKQASDEETLLLK